MTKNVIIENVIRQMSGATNTHNVYNTYVHTPQQETTASADVSMDDRLNGEAQKMEDTVHTHKERKKVKAQRNAQTVRENLKASKQHTQAEEAADAHMQDNYRPPDPPPPPEVDATMGDSHSQPEFIPMRETNETFNNKKKR